MKNKRKRERKREWELRLADVNRVKPWTGDCWLSWDDRQAPVVTSFSSRPSVWWQAPAEASNSSHNGRGPPRQLTRSSSIYRTQRFVQHYKISSVLSFPTSSTSTTKSDRRTKFEHMDAVRSTSVIDSLAAGWLVLNMLFLTRRTL